YVYTTIGSAGDFGGTAGVDTASIYLKLVPRRERSVSQQSLGRTIRDELERVSGVTPTVYTSGFGGGQKQIQLQVRGTGGSLTEAAEMVAAQMRQVQGAVDVDLSTKGVRPELDVQVDRSLASSLGVTVGEIAQALRIGFAGVDAGDWVDPSGETRDVMV